MNSLIGLFGSIIAGDFNCMLLCISCPPEFRSVLRESRTEKFVALGRFYINLYFSFCCGEPVWTAHSPRTLAVEGTLYLESEGTSEITVSPFLMVELDSLFFSFLGFCPFSPGEDFSDSCVGLNTCCYESLTL